MQNLSIMIKPSSSLCNLRCKYCFYHSLAAARESFSYGFMSEQTAQNLIDTAFSFADGGSVAFAFQGGEPLLSGLEFFNKFVEYANTKNTKNSKLFFSLQTNGTLVTEEWAKFFAENKFLIGLSLDGDQKANRNRLDKDLDFTFGKIIDASKLFKKYGVDFNILTVLTGYVADNIEHIYKFFKSNDFKFLQFIPCLRPFGDKSEGENYMTVMQYAAFMIKLFNMYVKDFVDGNYVSVRQFDNYVNMYLGKPPEQCGLGGVCGRQFVVEGDGSVFPCDFYCTDEWNLGNVNQTSLKDLGESEKAKSFIAESLKSDPRCKACNVYPICRGGGCKRNKADRDYCEAYKTFFSSCAPLFKVFKG